MKITKNQNRKQNKQNKKNQFQKECASVQKVFKLHSIVLAIY